jgi:hypothetical protein
VRREVIALLVVYFVRNAVKSNYTWRSCNSLEEGDTKEIQRTAWSFSDI